MSEAIDIGITQEDREAIAEGLKRLLADTYTMYVKTHNFHWNVTGPMFNTLHTMLEEHYTELATAVDEIAERIRALGVFAPGSFAQFKEYAIVQEETGIPSAEQMVAILAKDNETLSKVARSIMPLIDKADDEPSADLLVGRMQIHEKNAWMLRSLIAR